MNVKHIYLKNHNRFDLLTSVTVNNDYELEEHLIKLMKTTKELKGKKINYFKHVWQGYYKMYYWGNLSLQLIVSDLKLLKNGQPFNKYAKEVDLKQ